MALTKERIQEIKNTTPNDMTDVELDELCTLAYYYLTGPSKRKMEKDKEDLHKLSDTVKKLGEESETLIGLLETYKGVVEHYKATVERLRQEKSEWQSKGPTT